LERVARHALRARKRQPTFGDHMTVRAKFKVQHITVAEGGMKTVRLTPVTSGSPENEAFYKWTPGGGIDLSTVNEAAAEQFVPGKQFYVDFTPAD
jgi:hypothetical protein